MPVNQLIDSQMDDATFDAVMDHLKQSVAALQPGSRNLTPEERQRWGSINEQNKLQVQKAADFRNQQPGLSSPDVDWTTFEKSLQSRKRYEAIENLVATLQELCSDTRILHDYYLYQCMLTDYDYTKYKANSASAGGGYTQKYEELKQFFPNPNGNPPKE